MNDFEIFKEECDYAAVNIKRSKLSGKKLIDTKGRNKQLNF
jgi:hypothetical protein